MSVDAATATAARVDRSWWSWSRSGGHGGHPAAPGLVTARARLADQGVDGRPARSLTAHFPHPVDDRPLTFSATVDHAGRGRTTAGSSHSHRRHVASPARRVPGAGAAERRAAMTRRRGDAAAHARTGGRRSGNIDPPGGSSHA